MTRDEWRNYICCVLTVREELIQESRPLVQDLVDHVLAAGVWLDQQQANRDKAVILFLARRYDECVDQCRRTLELDAYSPPAHTFLGRAYERLGRPQEAVEAYVTPLTFSEQNRDMVAALRAAVARQGIKGFWETRLQYLLKEGEIRAYSVATAYMMLGDHEQALAWLEKLHAERGAWIRGLKVQPQWDPLRADPRFQDLLRRANVTSAPASLFSQ